MDGFQITYMKDTSTVGGHLHKEPASRVILIFPLPLTGCFYRYGRCYRLSRTGRQRIHPEVSQRALHGTRVISSQEAASYASSTGSDIRKYPQGYAYGWFEQRLQRVRPISRARASFQGYCQGNVHGSAKAGAHVQTRRVMCGPRAGLRQPGTNKASVMQSRIGAGCEYQRSRPVNLVSREIDVAEKTCET